MKDSPFSRCRKAASFWAEYLMLYFKAFTPSLPDRWHRMLNACFGFEIQISDSADPNLCLPVVHIGMTPATTSGLPC